MNIKISQENLGTLCICAIRYCHGRETYMPILVRDIITPFLSKLSDKTLSVMLDDCDFQEKMHLYGDEKIDKPGWLVWREFLKAEQKMRQLKEETE